MLITTFARGKRTAEETGEPGEWVEATRTRLQQEEHGTAAPGGRSTSQRWEAGAVAVDNYPGGARFQGFEALSQEQLESLGEIQDVHVALDVEACRLQPQPVHDDHHGTACAGGRSSRLERSCFFLMNINVFGWCKRFALCFNVGGQE